MNVRMNIFATMLDVVALVVIGVGTFFAPFILIWALDDGFSSGLGISWALSVDAWFLGHGVPLQFSMDPDLLQSLSLTDNLGTFTVDIALMGDCFITVFWGYRLGLRPASRKYPLSTWFTAVGFFLVLNFCLVFFLPQHEVSISVFEAVVRPSLFLAGGLVFANWKLARKRIIFALQKVIPNFAMQIIRFGLKAGSGSVIGLLGVSSVVVSVLVLMSFTRVISLYESLQPGAWGIIALSVLQLAMIPNIIIWVSNWLVGPGIAVGAGSLVSPVGTNSATLPALPIVGVVPESASPLGISTVIVPILISVAASAFAYPHLEQVVKNQSSSSKLGILFTRRPMKYFTAAFLAGIVGGLLGMVFTAMVSGSAGPGRFETVGADPVQILLWLGSEVTLGALVGIVSRIASRRVSSKPR